MSDPALSRRPLTSRDTKWARSIAAWLARKGFRPNAISVLSMVFSAASAAALWAAPGRSAVGTALLFVVAALCVQLRLLCNLLDGMVAVEGGLRTKSGEIYNELPDRISDVLSLLGAGLAAGSMAGLVLGGIAALLAVGTAYVRALGAAAGAGQCFLGPMAKPHRMALLTAGCVTAAGMVFWGHQRLVFEGTLALMIAGVVVTCWRRTVWIMRQLEQR